MRSNIFLLGNSPVLLELIINHFNSNEFANKIFVLEDDIYKVQNIKNLEPTLLKVISFDEGHQLISNKENNPKLYIGVSSTPIKRFNVYESFTQENTTFPNIYQKSAKLSNYCKIYKGSYFGEYTTIEPNSEIGEFCFIQSHSHIGHDSKIGKFSILGGSVTINGGCKIEDFCLIGSAVTIINNKIIGKGSVIQAGTCITKDIPPFSFVHGNPCKILPIEFLGKDFANIKKI
ncbi:hypothetical protein [Prochlorococcus sp. MIT 0604]|uniref:hypothetical protein n=1 Tax=Prochlorococcus sp. MIT 0604 TaxID=1501268 RepID=UPI0004F72DF8|nr:hypothetical protein [Prochlorococcus sp. MIT 0604]AIQ95517.1 acetyltransferase [Prochlorococcus sp. MIT 0604]